MDYKICKQLKDAGFSQRKEVTYIYFNEKTEKESIGESYGTPPNCCYIPTLSELIEACGDELFGLQRSDNQTGNKWSAWSKFPEALVEKGAETPEIAVANLYLALNKK